MGRERVRDARKRRGASAACAHRWAAGLLAAALTSLPASAAGELEIPQSLREGWGFGDDIRDLGESLDGGYELSERDLDCDGKPEVLLERVALRGTTGNRVYVLFDHEPGGYRYLGESAAVWSVIDYGASGGCYLVTFSRAGGTTWVLELAATRNGSLEKLGRLELSVGDGGSDEDNAVASALRAGGLQEERLLRLFAASRAVALGDLTALPWVERSTVEEVVEEVEGYGRQVFERVMPAEVGAAPANPWWGPVSERMARHWSAAVEAALVAGEVGEERPYWLPPPGAAAVEVDGSRVDAAARLALPLGRSPVGVIVGRFDARIARSGETPPRRLEITWAALLETTRLGEPGPLLELFLGTASDGESRRIFRLERLTNVDFDREQEVVIEEEAYAGRAQWVLDLSRPGEVAARELHAGAWD